MVCPKCGDDGLEIHNAYDSTSNQHNTSNDDDNFDSLRDNKYNRHKSSNEANIFMFSEAVMKIENQLEQIAKSYDRHVIEHGNKDAPSYDKLPDYITSNPNYSHKKKENESDWEDVRRKKLKDYLSPAKNMNFIHLGCNLSLMLKGYDEWPSTYFGIDISN